MNCYLLLYKGPATPPGVSHEGWPEWFAQAGEAVVDRGSPMVNGCSIINAEDRDRVADLLKDHPFLTYGPEYTIEVFELPNR
jgi:hypothetical protein